MVQGTGFGAKISRVFANTEYGHNIMQQGAAQYQQNLLKEMKANKPDLREGMKNATHLIEKDVSMPTTTNDTLVKLGAKE